MSGPLEVSEIASMLTDRIDDLVSYLFPNAMRQGPEMCVGSLAGEKGQSLRIHVGRNSRRGVWRDFSADQGGDALELVCLARFGGNKKEAIQWAISWMGLDSRDPERLQQYRLEARAAREKRDAIAEAERNKRIASARARWHQGVPIAGTIVETYLQGRGIDLRALGKAPGAIRFHSQLQYGWAKDGAPKLILPGMVTMITALSGQHIATHRTFLKPDGSGKADARDGIPPDAKGRPGDSKKVSGPYTGGHIPVWKGTQSCPLRDIAPGTDIYVSEGIEDGLTVACADPSLRVIAMVALGNLMALELPPQIGNLIILKQNDAPGSDAAKLLARAVSHQRAQGHRVLFVEAPQGVKDLNDLVQQDRNRGVG